MTSGNLNKMQYSRPPIPPISGLTKKRRYWKTAVNRVIYNQEKHIRDLKISGGIGGRRYGGEAINGGAVLEARGDDCGRVRSLTAIDDWCFRRRNYADCDIIKHAKTIEAIFENKVRTIAGYRHSLVRHTRPGKDYLS